MKLQIFFVLLVCLGTAGAVRITLFMDTDTYIKRAHDIVIADCIIEPNEPIEDGTTNECILLHILKGDRKSGPCKVFTIRRLKGGTRYLLANTGGQVGDTDFLALAELAVVPIPSNFDFEILKSKSLPDQLYAIFDLRKHELQRQLDPLLKERDLLEKALRDRIDNLYISPGPIEFDTIQTTQATNYRGGKVTYLQFGSHQMEWSRQDEHAGYLYAREPSSRKVPWQWAVLETDDFNQLQGKPLRVRFQGVYPPIYGQTLTVQEGQMVLLCYAEEPQTVYIAKFEKQEGDVIHVRYITVPEQKKVTD